MKILSEERIVITPERIENRTIRPIASNPRTPGIHVQAVNKSLGIAAGKLSSDEDDNFPFERFTSTSYPLMPALGVAWEEFRASLYHEDELIWQPCELERDSIYGTPDGLILTYDHPCLWECKQTTKKFQRIDSCWMYMKQGLSYCAMSREVRHVLYDICWLLGDYSRPYQPIGSRTLVEFTESEIETWWEIVKKASVNVKAEGV